MFSDTSFSRKKNPSSASVCRRMCIQKVLPLAVSNGHFYLGQMNNCLSSYSLGKLLCPYSQPWDSFTSAVWVKPLSVSISFRDKNTKPFPSARIDSICKTTLPANHHLQALQLLKYILWTFCITRSHGTPLAMVPVQESTHLTDLMLLLMPIYSYAQVCI